MSRHPHRGVPSWWNQHTHTHTLEDRSRYKRPNVPRKRNGCALAILAHHMLSRITAAPAKRLIVGCMSHVIFMPTPAVCYSAQSSLSEPVPHWKKLFFSISVTVAYRVRCRIVVVVGRESGLTKSSEVVCVCWSCAGSELLFLLTGPPHMCATHAHAFVSAHERTWGGWGSARKLFFAYCARVCMRRVMVLSTLRHQSSAGPCARTALIYTHNIIV